MKKEIFLSIMTSWQGKEFDEALVIHSCRKAADVIEVITNSGIKYNKKDEVVNVCQAIQEMREEESR